MFDTNIYVYNSFLPSNKAQISLKFNFENNLPVILYTNSLGDCLHNIEPGDAFSQGYNNIHPLLANSFQHLSEALIEGIQRAPSIMIAIDYVKKFEVWFCKLISCKFLYFALAALMKLSISIVVLYLSFVLLYNLHSYGHFHYMDYHFFHYCPTLLFLFLTVASLSR